MRGTTLEGLIIASALMLVVVLAPFAAIADAVGDADADTAVPPVEAAHQDTAVSGDGVAGETSEDGTAGLSAGTPPSEALLNGDEGADGSSGEDGGTEAGDVVITTGDAVAQSETENTLNTNNTHTLAQDADGVTVGAAEEDSADGTETTMQQSAQPTTGEQPDGGSLSGVETTGDETPTETSGHTLVEEYVPDEQSIVVDTENLAAVANELDTEATTGANSVISDGGATITTGEAVSSTNVLNVINTNIFNSNGILLFLDNLLGGVGSIDVRSLLLFNPVSVGAGCSLGGCGGIGNIDTNITSSSTARISNTVVTRASTGENSAQAQDGALITTGNAYAAANVINVVNTTLVDSNYLLLSFNNFGDWAGDLVLPGKDFFSKLFFGTANNASTAAKTGSESAGTTSTSVANANTATVENAILTDAATGDNTALGGSITTGNASTNANTINHVNRNFFGQDSVVVLLRVHGSWGGNIYNAPPGIVWEETSNGIALWSDPVYGPGITTESSGLLSVSASPGGEQSTAVTNTTNALITNDISVMALTGDNRVDGGSGSQIATGDAYAGANLFNIANTNVFGSNMLYAIVNVFGDWSGDIAFGRPDLWIGGWLQMASSPVRPGTPLEYHYSIANRGDADAHDVQLVLNTDDQFTWLFDGGLGSNDEAVFNLGTIAAGEVKDVTLDGAIRKHIAEGEHLLTTTASVSSDQPDANTLDDTEVLSFSTYEEPRPSSGTPGVYYEEPPNLIVTKTNSTEGPVLAPASVEYTITVRNESDGPAYYGTLVDMILDGAGKEYFREEWELDTVLPHEEITVSYTMEFEEHLLPGVYTNYAFVEGYGGHPSLDPFYGWAVESNLAESEIVIGYRDEDKVATEESTDGASGNRGGTNEPADTAVVETASTEKIQEPAPEEPVDTISTETSDPGIVIIGPTRLRAPLPLTSITLQPGTPTTSQLAAAVFGSTDSRLWWLSLFLFAGLSISSGWVSMPSGKRV